MTQHVPFSYNSADEVDESTLPRIKVKEGGKELEAMPIRFKVVKPRKPDGDGQEEWDQTGDAANNMRYVATLGLQHLGRSPIPRIGKAVIVGGAPSVKKYLGKIRKLAKDPDNIIFALNWTHTWLIENGIIPDATVFFEIDVEPDSVLKKAHKDVTYFICSHCDRRTFDALKGYKRVVWHSHPNSPGEEKVSQELFPFLWQKDTNGKYVYGSHFVGGGVNSFTRTMTVALMCGYRNLELFGCDSSFPKQSKSTHVEGYETVNDVKTDSLAVHAKNEGTGEIKTFYTVGYLALQVEEFKEYCSKNHWLFALRVHGGEDSLLKYVHSVSYPQQYQP